MICLLLWFRLDITLNVWKAFIHSEFHFKHLPITSSGGNSEDLTDLAVLGTLIVVSLDEIDGVGLGVGLGVIAWHGASILYTLSV